MGLQEFLTMFGEVKEIKFNAGKSSIARQKVIPWAIFTMKSPLGTRKIIDDLKNHEINDQKVVIKLATSQPGIKEKEAGAKTKEAAKAAEDANILIIKGSFKKEQEDELLQLLGKYGKITESRLRCSRVAE